MIKWYLLISDKLFNAQYIKFKSITKGRGESKAMSNFITKIDDKGDIINIIEKVLVICFVHCRF